MRGSALGRQHTTEGLEGEKQLAQLIGIPAVPCGHLPIPQNLTCAQTFSLDLPSSPSPHSSAPASPKPSFQDPLSGR